MDAALGRLLGEAIDGPHVRRAASLATAAVRSADFSGRPLGAANAAFEDPGAPHPRSGKPPVRYVSIAATVMSLVS